MIDLDHDVAMAEHALLSVTREILVLATEPPMRRRMNRNDIAEAIQRLEDALVLIDQHKQREAA